MKKLLCRIGIHNWGKDGVINSITTPIANKCKWCEGIRVFRMWGYTFHPKGTFEDRSKTH